ncbi:MULTISPECIES: MarR family transcriptional regulator [Haloferax]|uniref:MarR family transcriptional regulator n=3 Tax=Haloferacaceae TaxID=1644056 RepID=A0A6G1Z1Z4_9EURY|nr:MULTISPECIES: MarR family transcriptional regulator [Haloferax]KAB1185825.1 MarR family transcriptional regulator [Haloferax sp. CBA1149]KAB1186892.1 MarR family transcriptional regulator [Haloferax sp. CBA1149]KAB1187797.1 MarR family transcriptional regulator [Haloferax sp. CBA1149]MRW79522.1 MarR family transcriptional regulator [Haloferax marinisediminis]MRW80458.1 MarR family transcriptional regulator [Haloferax marinisediminis]
MSHVASAPHETRGNLLYTEYEDSPYWAVRQLYNHIDGGAKGIEVEIPRYDAPGTEVWTVSLGFHESGLSPSKRDTVNSLLEYDINAYGEGQRKLPIIIQPRLGWDDENRPNSVPANLGRSTNVKLNNTVNVELDEIPHLIREILRAVCERVGFDWSRRYFTETPHEYSTITQHERYIRILRDMAKKLVHSDGVFMKLFMLVADLEGSHVVYDSNNEKVVGYNHQLRFDRKAIEEISKNSRHRPRGMQLKHYHPEHVRKKSGDDPLYHPKLGALYKKNLNQDQSVRWTDRHDLVDDLEEKMMNVLEWAGIPTNPGSWFVEDDHFVPGESDRRIAFWDDPTPEIEASQESVIIRTLQELEDSDRDVLEYVAMADGGTVDGAAEETGWSEATVYRVLQRLSGLLDCDNRVVSWVSSKMSQQVREIVSVTEDVVESNARLIENVLSVDPRDLERSGRALQNWLNRYGAEVVQGMDDRSKRVKIRVRSILTESKNSTAKGEYLPDVIDAGYSAWCDAGLDAGRFYNAIIEFDQAYGPKQSAIASQHLR